MNRSLLSRLRDHLAVRRARRRRLEAFLFFSDLPHDMQADLMRPSLFDAFEENARAGFPACPNLRLG
ncbi:hypothetical protein PZ895_08710 [Mesorhizobium sp. YIM 152430]|jgi:hypothetical protein|uniref:hypothetical protein n=1 Tax=Mesorhizobium sp. YIM 152430 TaxID=3031761 RepID=UPI0023DC265D|nr:hypothetical protein [Mesorhizobium sp. YIM 152430]MDF1599858.1 hypothetical protein [Mesorhizobium sp. YIM 152430]